ncbi:hypothetical protein MHH81_04795 [Psychrobacillus sp. FSL H8-0484]|uniref:hypothetical protein n=1 Tax=Psychrobacillus sp. FSL H8-0484 TaxID=2921390 RepID=UPI0030FB8ADE
MGYIIPVQPLQAQIYANRMLMDEYNFAYISNVSRMKMKSLFQDHLEEQVEKQLSEQLEPSKQLPLYKSFIQPKPLKLSPIIVDIYGKGNIVNVYI